jgi:Tol biopolymer transport system component
MKSIREVLPAVAMLLMMSSTALGAPRHAEAAAARAALPLEPQRQLEFSSDEGTWMSLDVAPDGRTIVFDLLGDLYELPIAGGEARALTQGMAFDSQPRYSPDGRAIAFISDREGNDGIWIVGADGKSPRRLASGDAATVFTSPEWTPDGNHIVVTETSVWTRGRSGKPQLVLYRLADGFRQELVVGAAERGLYPHGAAFGADGRALYFSGRKSRTDEWAIFKHDMRSAQAHVLSTPTRQAVRPTLSADGRWLAFVVGEGAQRGVRLRNLLAAREDWLLQSIEPDLLPGYGAPNGDYDRDLMPGWAFTPDSRALIASFGGKIWRVELSSRERTAIPFRAPVRLQMGALTHATGRIEDDAKSFAREIRDPQISPDGRRAVFSAVGRLWLMDLKSGTPRLLTRAPRSAASSGEFEPAWSPDGRYIAYAAWSDESGGALYRIRGDGAGEPERLTETPAFYAGPAYAPDGLNIAFVQGSLEARRESLALKGGYGEDHAALACLELRWIPAGGGDSRLLSPVHTLSRPHFTRDAQRVFLYDRLSSDELWLVSVGIDDGDLQRHLRITEVTPLAGETPREVRDIRLSPDGRSALALAARSVHRIELPGTRGVATEVQLDLSRLPAGVHAKRLSNLGAKAVSWSPDGKTAVFNLGAHLHRSGNGGSAEPSETRVRIPLQKPRQSGTLVLKGARVITMAGAGVIESGDIVVAGSRIAAVGPRGKVPIPRGAKILDVGGATIIPGLIDMHAHPNAPDRIPPNQYWEFFSYLSYGVTTIHDPGPGPGVTDGSLDDWLSYADLLESGRMLGPRLYTTGPLVMWYDEIETLDDALRVLRLRRDVFGARSIKYYDAGNRTQRQLVAMAARQLGLGLTNEPSRRFDTAFNHVIDGYSGIEHDMGLTPLYGDVVRVLAHSGTSINMTFNPMHIYGHDYSADDAHLRHVTPAEQVEQYLRQGRELLAGAREEFGYEIFARGLAPVVRNGGRVAFGGHSWAEGLGTHFELWAMASGVSNEEALRVGTLGGARSMGLDLDLGSIEAGKLADLLVLERNPLQNIRHSTSLRYVMQGGVLREVPSLKAVRHADDGPGRRLEPRP